MFLEYAESIVDLGANIIALVVCLFQYINHKNKAVMFTTAVYICAIMSCYYWTVYLLIMGETPDVSDFYTYVGWNVAYLLLLYILLITAPSGEKGFFHPLMLIPIPLNVWQLSLYLPFGGEANSIYQVTIMTLICVFSIRRVCWYLKNKSEAPGPPFLAMSLILLATASFGMWTSSCFDAPIGDLYYPFSFVSSGAYLLVALAAASAGRAVEKEAAEPDNTLNRKYRTVLKVGYLLVMVVCCLGGVFLGLWMRDTMRASMETAGETGIYKIIPVVLFVISLFLPAFAMLVVFVVTFMDKTMENNALRDARMLAERSNAAKSEFLANMSHEIRTPINAMLGMNEIILRESLQARSLLPSEREAVRAVFSDICKYAGNIESAGNSLLSIINDILDFSKIESGKLVITEAKYNLSSVLNDVSNMIVFKARAKGLEFYIDVENTMPEVLFGDEIRVRQIITNLLNNAVKYTDRGSIRMSVKMEAREGVAEGKVISMIVSVSDSGIGIKKEDMERLFNKFERMELERNSAVEGTGLGLAITRSLLDLMGGSIGGESIYGEGSTFTAVIPQKIISCEAVGDFRDKFEKSIQDARVYRESFTAPEARILIVDDTAMNLKVAVGLLKNTGINIDTAGSGEEAITLAGTIPYDVILMDQRMPKMDGTVALHRIREEKEGANHDTPIICLTADAVSGAKDRYMAEGFTDYLTKPVDGASLEKMLITYLPQEKVVVQRSEESGDEESSDISVKDILDALTGEGIDTSEGLKYCEHDSELYLSVLSDYHRGAPARIHEMQTYYRIRDWKNYCIQVHALKSTSKMIGAMELSGRAAALEEASAVGRDEEIRRNHGALIEAYTKLYQAMERIIGGVEEPEEDILEFSPQ